MRVRIGKVARELAELEEQIDRALERAFSTGLQVPRRGDSFRPALDVYETHDSVLVRVELAGVRGDEIRITVDGEYLQISGRRGLRTEPTPERHLKMEISEGHFERVLRLGAPYDRERVNATLANGILTIVLPRAEAEVHRIPVKSE